MRPFRLTETIGALAALALLASGCATQMAESESSALASLAATMPAQQAQISSLADELRAVAGQQSAMLGNQASIEAELVAVKLAVVEKPACAAVAPAAPVTTTETRRVAVHDDKMVVGQLERIWVSPPAALITARVDTGASSNSMHAEDLAIFERDGEKWARFKVHGGKDDKEVFEIERKVERYVRVVQQADRKGSRRPVVRLQVALGEIQGTFDFTLADRSHLANEVLLGRNFLTDVTMVDVGRRYVQTAFDPSKAGSED
jgi:hypothetical protein